MLPLLLALAPDRIDLPGWAGYALWGVLAVVVVLGLLFVLVLRNLHVELPVDELQDGRLHPELESAVAAMEAVGFERLLPGWIAHMTPRVVLVPMLNRQEGVFGSVFRPMIDKAPVVTDMVSSLHAKQGVLCTTAIPQAATLPVPDGSFLQILPGQDAVALLESHRRGLLHLRANGLRPDPAADADAGKFLEQLRMSLRRQRQCFLRRPVRSLLRAVFVTVTGRSRHLGALADQTAAQLDIAAARNPLARVGR